MGLSLSASILECWWMSEDGGRIDSVWYSSVLDTDSNRVSHMGTQTLIYTYDENILSDGIYRTGSVKAAKRNNTNPN